MNNSDAAFSMLLIAIMAIFLTGLGITWLDSSYEAKACDKLEKQLNLVLDYNYNKGCHLPGDM